MAADIESHILMPILDAKVGEMIPLKAVADLIASLNAEDEDVSVEDDMPTAEEVVAIEKEEAIGGEEGVIFHDGIVSDPKDFDNATVEKIETGNGEVIMITIPENMDGKNVEPVPVVDLADIAGDVAKDIVEDLAVEDEVEVELPAEPEEPKAPEVVVDEPEVIEEPVKPKLHVCGPHTLEGKHYDLSQLGTDEKEGYYSRVFDETDNEPAEGWLQWNYCAPFEEGRFARYYRKKYGNMEYDVTIADTDYIENLTITDGVLRFEMETSTICDTNKAGEDYKFKFVTHLSCDPTKTGAIDWENDLERVWYKEHCEYHVMLGHNAGCGLGPDTPVHVINT